MTKLYYAQQREDEWIDNNLPLPRKGFYVDIGAGHPFTTSNTAFLRDRKWHGLAVDGNPCWTNDWKDNPAFVCAVISQEPQEIFYEDPDNPWNSRIAHRGHRRTTTTLEDLFAEYHVGKIDFLSVDVEGREFDVLKHLDFAKHQPSIIIVEYNTAGIGEDRRCAPLLTALGYDLKFENPINMIFHKP